MIEKKKKPKLIVSTIFSLGALVLIPAIIIIVILSTQVKDNMIEQNIALETESILLMAHDIEREILFSNKTGKALFNSEDLLSLEAMQQFYNTTYKNSDKIIVLLNGNDKIIASNKENLINSIYNKTTPSKHEIVISEDIGKTDWKLIKIINTKTITGHIDKVFIAVYLSLMFMFSIYLSYSLFILVLIRIPVKQLLISMDKIGKGTYEEKEYATYFDEFESLAYGFNMMSYELEHLNKQMQCKYNEELKSEIEALRHQINPHFMCGTLEMIKRMAKIEHNEDTRMLSDALLTITEDNLTNTGITTDIEHEISNIDAYMYIMKVRYDDSIEFVENIDPSVLKAQIPSLMLQPLIDNSIFHGFKGIERDKIIKLSIKRKDDNLIITLRDNGKGVDKVKLTKLLEENDDNHHSIKTPNHLGLKNINKRLSLLYSNSYSFTFNSKHHNDDSFFEQTITIPFSTKQR